jgi:hypothetical protein
MGQRRKLSDDQVREIMACVRMRDRVADEMSTVALAARYGVSRALIASIGTHGDRFREAGKLKSCRAAMDRAAVPSAEASP